MNCFARSIRVSREVSWSPKDSGITTLLLALVRKPGLLVCFESPAARPDGLKGFGESRPLNTVLPMRTILLTSRPAVRKLRARKLDAPTDVPSISSAAKDMVLDRPRKPLDTERISPCKREVVWELSKKKYMLKVNYYRSGTPTLALPHLRRAYPPTMPRNAALPARGGSSCGVLSGTVRVRWVGGISPSDSWLHFEYQYEP